ncbi:hypothetical protein KY346_03020 [Candidatus Woesearchaeota archaeon]|nr:hypothetical protein [Candidatus Woesearchaeota archaeon]
MRKAQGLPITTIIIAALALVVLVVLFAIFTGRLSIFGRGISECPGICVAKYSESGATTSGVKTADATAACPNPQLQRPLTGTYIEVGQPANRKAEDLVFCSKCCVSTV